LGEFGEVGTQEENKVTKTIQTPDIQTGGWELEEKRRKSPCE